MNKLNIKEGIYVLSLFFLLLSCGEDKLDVGLEILPESDILSAKADTLSVECYTFKGLQSPPNHFLKDNYPIGHVHDDVFGETVAEAVLEFFYNSSGDNYIPKNIVNGDSIISLKLYLCISKEANSKTIEHLKTYGEEEAFDIEAYLLGSVYNFNEQYVGSGIHSDYLEIQSSRSGITKHNVLVDTTNEIPGLLENHKYLELELDHDLALSLYDTTIYNTANFTNRLPGLLLRAKIKDNSPGALQNYYFNNSLMVLEILKKESETSSAYNTVYTTFKINKHQVSYRNNHTKRDAEIENVFRDTINQSDRFYLQSLGGTRGIIKLNSLASFKNSNLDSVAINLAELVIPINQDIEQNYLSDTILFKLPERISAQGIRSITVLEKLIDDNIDATYFNGYLDKDKFEYRINLSEYVHKYMLGEIEYTLLNVGVAVNSATTSSELNYHEPSRVVLNSGLDHLMNKAYLRIIYTSINN